MTTTNGKARLYLVFCLALGCGSAAAALFPQTVHADDCLLDTNNNGRADSTGVVDTDAAANSNNDDTSLACGFVANAGVHSTAVGAFSNASADDATAVGSYTNATAVDSTALGYKANATATNSVALGVLSTADQPNTVSVGAVGAERRVVNVAPGTAATDAPNLAQLNAEATTRAQSDLQINQRIANEESARAALATSLANETNARVAADLAASNQLLALNGRLDSLQDYTAASTAVAVALGGNTFLPDMKFNLSANLGTYDGAHAGSLQIGALVSSHVAVNAGVATGFNKRGQTAGRVGLTFGW